MDRDQFDRLSRLIAAAGTRRAALRLLLGGAIVGTLPAEVEPAAARDRRGRGQKRDRVRGEQVFNCIDRGCISCAGKKIGPGVNLTRCDLNRRIDLAGTNLGGSNLTKACLGDSDLRNVSFRGAQLQNTCFCGSNLRGADFRGSNVTAAQLACARVGCTTILPNGKKAVTCAPGETCCDGDCVNTATDPRNCGSCGTRCQVYQVCEEGGCTCEAVGPDSICNRDPNWSCCAPGTEPFVCSCTLVDSGEFAILETCGDGPCEPPGIPCVGPVCQACCPPGSTCDPSTGTCLR